MNPNAGPSSDESPVPITGGTFSTEPKSGESQSASDGVQRATASVRILMQTPSRIPVSTKFPHRPPPGKSVGWVYPGWKAATKFTSSAESAANAIGWQLVPIGFDVAKLDSVNTAVQEAVDKNVDYLVVLTAPSSAFSSGLEKAKASGIPVIQYAVVTEPAASQRGVVGCFSCSYSSRRVGSAFAALVVSDSQGRGHGAFVELSEQPALHETAQAYLEYLEADGSHCKGSMISTSHAAVSAGTVSREIVSYLAGDPSVNYVILPADGIADDLPSLLRSSGLDKRVKVLYGVAPTIDHLQKIAEGTFYAALEYPGSPYNFWLLMYGLAAHSIGLPQFLQTDGPTTDLEFVLRTTDNLPTPLSKWTGPVDYQQQYLALMGLESADAGR